MSHTKRGVDITKFIKAASIFGGIALAILAIRSFTAGGINNDECNGLGRNEEKAGYCNISDNNYDQLVIITGNTQNTPAPKIDFEKNDELRLILHDVFYNTEKGNTPKISIVSAAGNNYSIDFDNSKKVANNITASKSNFNRLAKELNSAIKTPATEAGANYMGAVNEANSLISASSENPVIVIVGSGYSDSGAIDFAHDEIIENYNDDKSSLASLLEGSTLKKGSLNGTTVYWYNLGNVVAPQPSLNEYRDTTKEIYKSIFSYMGAKNINLSERTEVSANAKSVESQYTVQPTFVNKLETGDTISINDNVGMFKGDEAVLLNPAEVRDKLASFAKKFKSTINKKLKLTGYIAYCANDSSLALERANVIKSILVKDLGIDESKIVTEGMPGSPSKSKKEAYTCDSPLPDSERRTVVVEVIEE